MMARMAKHQIAVMLRPHLLNRIQHIRRVGHGHLKGVIVLRLGRDASAKFLA